MRIEVELACCRVQLQANSWSAVPDLSDQIPTLTRRGAYVSAQSARKSILAVCAAFDAKKRAVLGFTVEEPHVISNARKSDIDTAKVFRVQEFSR